MKHTKHVHILLASILLASVAFAQTTDLPAASNSSGGDEIATARSRYEKTTDVLHADDDGRTLAQFPRRGPGPPFPSQHRYPRGRENYQTSWMDHGDAGHTLIGAAIGFGIGAALGATNGARNHTSIGDGVIIGGSLVGLIGAAIGASHGRPYFFARHRRSYPRSWQNDDKDKDEEADRTADSPDFHDSHAKQNPVGRIVSAGTTSPAKAADPSLRLGIALEP
jgi:hypothetical protein